MPTQQELGQHLDISAARVSQYVAEGIFPKAKHGKWEFDFYRTIYIRHLRSGGGAVADGSLDPVKERARKDKEQADKTALENKQRRGELVEVGKVKLLWARLASETKGRLLSIPTRVAPLLVHRESPAEIEGIIRKEVKAALGEGGNPEAECVPLEDVVI